jgi:tRNA threonylcarbamoyladenosine biosynthesis protein TsaB
LNILLLDTSTELEIVAIETEGDIHDMTGEVEVSHSRTLFERIDRCLKSASLGIREVDLFAVGLGPGSFTGIRIAVTTARMLARVNGSALVGLESPELFALGASRGHKQVLVAFDARKKRVFGALYARGNGGLEKILSPGDYPMEQVCRQVDLEKSCLALGSGSLRYRDILERECPPVEILHPFQPGLADAFKEARDRFRQDGDAALDVTRVLPCYRRKSDAEIMKEKQ